MFSDLLEEGQHLVDVAVAGSGDPVDIRLDTLFAFDMLMRQALQIVVIGVELEIHEGVTALGIGRVAVLSSSGQVILWLLEEETVN